MMLYEFTTEEEKMLKKIEEKPYMVPSLKLVNTFIRESKKSDLKAVTRKAFDNIHDFIRGGEAEVGKILQSRKKSGEIDDIKQSQKAVVGNVFPYLVIYIFLKNKQVGNIANNIFIANSITSVKKKFGDDFQDFVIYSGEETQKPDCDLIIYNEAGKMMILSLKTSLRERALQTYKWKLLLEIAHSNDTELRNKFNISYKGKNMPLVCFATVNFYDEINKPQSRGMFKFFDKAFIAKPNKANSFIVNMSEIVDFIKRNM